MTPKEAEGRRERKEERRRKEILASIELHPGAKNQTGRIKNCHGAVNTHSIANGFGGFSCEPYALDGGSQNSTHNFPGLTSWWHWSVGLLTGMLDYRTETNQLRSNVY